MAPPGPPFQARRTLLAAFLFAVALLAGLNIASVHILSAVRAYVGGESLWSKGRNQATRALVRYIGSRDERDWRDFEAGLSVPLGDRVARLELDKPDYDPEVVRRGFLQGGLHPDDIDAMASLYRKFHRVEFMARAIAIWHDADDGIAELAALAQRIRARVSSSELTPVEAAALNADLQVLDAKLFNLEHDFSATLGGASRTAVALVNAAALSLAVLLSIGGALLLRHVFARLDSVEGQLRESNERWAMAMRGAGMAAFEWNPASDMVTLVDPDGPRRTTAAAFSAAVDERDRWRVLRALRSALRRGGDFTVEYRTAAGGGTGAGLRWIRLVGSGEIDGAPRLVGVATDITERRLAKEALEESEARYRLLWQTAPEAVVILDAENRLQYANAAAEAIFGHPVESMIGQSLAMIQPPDLRPAHEHGMARYLATGKRHVDWRAVETRALHRDGHEFPVEVSFSHMRLDGREMFAGFIRDISERHAAQAERDALMARLRESQKMEALGTLAGGIAHDFNNLLGAILGNAALAREHLRHDEPAQRDLDPILKAGARARELVQQILAFSRRQAQVLEKQPLRPVVEEAVTLLRVTMPPSVRLGMRLSDAPIAINADATQIGQVVMNLCTNAWHALQGSTGRVDVQLDAVEIDSAEASRLGLAVAGRYARLRVSDNGVGMSAEMLENIFVPFFTTKPVGQGTGLGLPVVHGIVIAHGGAIRIDSEPGRGTTVDVYLPCVHDWVPDEAPADSRPQPVGGGRHVACVDDDEMMLIVADRVLRKAGFVTTCFSDGRDAIAAVRAGQVRFDAVVTDYNMPECTGLQVAEAVMQSAPGTPVVMSSGFISDELRARAAEVGVHDIVQKQYTFEELAGVVAGALERAGTAPRPAG